MINNNNNNNKKKKKKNALVLSLMEPRSNSPSVSSLPTLKSGRQVCKVCHSLTSGAGAWW